MIEKEKKIDNERIVRKKEIGNIKDIEVKKKERKRKTDIERQKEKEEREIV